MAPARNSIEFTARGQALVWLAAASLLGAWLAGDPHVRLAAALLLAPLLLDFAFKARSLGAVAVQVAPRRAVAGVAFHELVTLRSRGRRRLRELLLSEPRTRGLPALVAGLAAGAQTRASLRCLSHARSHLLQRVFELRSDWPLGLLRARLLVQVATDLVTEPARVPIDVSRLQSIAERDPGPSSRRQRTGDEFHALREHQAAEEARGVHALRSAALGTLVRTEVRGRMPREVGLVLDLRRPPGRPLHLGQRRFEWSLGACAAALDHLRELQTVVRVFVLGSKTVQTAVADSAQHRQVLTFLAEAASSPYRPLEPAALRELCGFEHCLWIPAGGFQARAELEQLGTRVKVLGEVDA